MKLGTDIIKTIKSSFSFVILLSFLAASLCYSQIDYNMSLSNGAIINNNVIEFDVLIKGINNNFNLTSYQCSFLFNNEISNGGQLSFTYIEGTCELNNLPAYGIGINNTDGEQKLTFASMAGSDLITNNEVRVGRFRLQNTTPFSNVDPNIRWNFSGYVSTILTGDQFQNITVPVNHTSNLTLDGSSSNSSHPVEYKLLQNYPNPFNPNTTISFALPTEGNATLAIYNALGQRIDEVVNEHLKAGIHKVDFSGKDLSTGIYYCKLDVENKYSQIIKMVLLK